MSTLLDHLPALCNIIRRIAVGAGEITLNYYDQLLPDDIERKDDGSPVSLADKEAEIYIQKQLQDMLPDVPFIGEEASDAGRLPSLEGERYFWLVDPLDGTKEFITGGEDFTVNIALIRGNAPILGVVYAPVTGILYAGHEGAPAIRWSEDTGKDKTIKVRRPENNGLVVVTSRSHGDAQRIESFLQDFKIKKTLKKGSSLKICAIAEGKADIYPRLGPTCEWDTAAGHAVLKAAGGVLTDLDGDELTYGGARPKFLNPEFVAAGFDWVEETS